MDKSKNYMEKLQNVIKFAYDVPNREEVEFTSAWAKIVFNSIIYLFILSTTPHCTLLDKIKLKKFVGLALTWNLYISVRVQLNHIGINLATKKIVIDI